MILTKDELEQIRGRSSEFVRTCDLFALATGLEQAWQERDEAIMEGLRLKKELEKAERDAMTLALRLMGESESSFAPETHEVMTRWRVKCLKLIGEIDGRSTQ